MKNKRINRVGQKFGRFTVVSLEYEKKRFVNGNPKGHHVFWRCRCDCGNERVIEGTKFKNRFSCGCFLIEKNKITNTKHGACKGNKSSREYVAWQSMKSRCYRPSFANYAIYGGRGITVCGRWLKSFDNFLDDMGLRPSPKHSLDRIDVNGNYCPENCRWATKKEQSANTRTNRKITYAGDTRCIAEWARHFGLVDATLRTWIGKGLSMSEIEIRAKRRKTIRHPLLE